ncbi:LpqB family beta-propeller domain-containing protein [Cellulomonas sp. KRMCY2]|uniref:LpqB family beta-propeller domain-containing protein n=1 Tax=Cellulomonas sp. KRMCY2 TaxID=1304865 RepID=UPI0004B77C17|nr:LpqB family beta-propeller domain-containing protein [Cellulomonas sp. KRMCY2]
MTRRRRVTLVLVAAAAALSLVGCVAIPIDGPIQEGDVVPAEPGSAFPQASDPLPGASPVEIVNGFLTAGAAGLYDDFAVARKYLTGSASSGWDPRAGVILYPLQERQPRVEERTDGTILVSIPLAATVDAAGVYTEAEPGAAPRELVFELMRDSTDQWRVSQLDDGVVMAASSFTNQYRRTAVYFASPDRTQLVPDPRWFPTAKIATSAVSALLDGPSAWLRDAVVTGAPEGARLSTPAVSVSAERVASFDISSPAGLGVAADRNLLQAQLEAMLLRLPGTVIDDVVVTADGLPWEPTAATWVLDRDVAPASGPYVLQGEQLAVLDGGEVVPLEGVAVLNGLDARDPAISLDEQIRVVLDGTRRLMLLPPDGAAPVPLLTGSQLMAPSIDRYGWIWTGEQLSSGTLTAVRADSELVEVAAQWLEGRTVRSLRVARDGARVAIVSAGPSEGDVTVDVAAVVRDEDGTPRLLGETPLVIGAALVDATEVAWVDEVTVAVLGRSGAQNVQMVHLVTLGGPTSALPLKDGATAIAAGRGDRSLYLVDAEGALFSLQSGSWVREALGVRSPVFPG